MDAAGNYVSATDIKIDNGNTGTTGVMAQRFAASGTPLDASPFVVGSITSALGSLARDVDVGVNRKTGNFAVGWTQSTLTAVTESDTNFVQRYQANGTSLGTRMTVGPTTSFKSGCLGVHCWKTGSLSFLGPLFMLDSNELLAQWTQTFPGTASVACYSQHYDALGILSGIKHSILCPALAAAANGSGSSVVTELTGSTTGARGLSGQAYVVSGAKKGPNFEIVPTTASGIGHPAVSMDPAGNFVVAWEQNNASGSTQLMGRLYKAQ